MNRETKLFKRPTNVYATGFGTPTSANEFIKRQINSKTLDEPLILVSHITQKGTKYYAFILKSRYKPDDRWIFEKELPIKESGFMDEFEEKWMVR